MPFLFRELPYAVVNLAAQVVVAGREDKGPVASPPSNVIHRYLLSDPQYAALEEFIDAGLIRNVGSLEFKERFVRERLPQLAKQLAKIASRKFVAITAR